MKVERLTLRNFRNVQDSTLFPTPGVNFLVGPNGQGKTSFIEALGFLSTLRSFRESKTGHVIRWGQISGDVSCVLSAGSEAGVQQNWDAELKVSFQMTDPNQLKASKTAFVNGKPFRSSTQYLCQRFGEFELSFHAIVFNPSDHELVRGDPAVRRSYLDRVLAAEDTEYLKALQRYQRILNQRNSLLKFREPGTKVALLGFTEQMAKYASLLTWKRLGWILRVQSLLNPRLQMIAPGQPELKLNYLSQWCPEIEKLPLNNRDLNSDHFTGQGHPASLELLEQSFWTKVSTLQEAEWKAGHSLVGPHRDDWTFLLGNQVLKGHGSQGEVRSALLALKLSEIELFKSATGHRPLFLLDDFSSELDRERRLFLLDLLMKTDLQTFVTTTEDSVFIGKRYWISNGSVSAEEIAVKPEIAVKKEGMHDYGTKTV